MAKGIAKFDIVAGIDTSQMTPEEIKGLSPILGDALVAELLKPRTPQANDLKIVMVDVDKRTITVASRPKI